MRKVLYAKPVLALDHIPQHQPKGIPGHHFIEAGFVKGGKIGRKEELVRGIFLEDLHSPHFKHFLRRGGVLDQSSLDRSNLFGEGPDLLFEGGDFPKDLFSFHVLLKASVEMETFGQLNSLQILLAGDPAVDFRVFIGLVFGPVLLHDVDIGMNRDLLGDELENGF